MKRRELLTALGAGAFLAPAASSGQAAPKVWRIGYLSPRSGPVDSQDHAFRRGLADLGYVEGRNVAIEWRFANGGYERLPAMAAELVRMKVDVIVADSSAAIRAAQQATTTIPIVFPTTGDPVGSGFVASLARPGGNITGLSNANLDVSAKHLELLLAVVPKLSLVAVLGNPGSSTRAAIVKDLQSAARKDGRVRLLPVEARTPDEIERAFATLTEQRAGGLIIAADTFLISQQGPHIAALAIKHRLPSITTRGYVEAGGLMTYGHHIEDSFRRSASYVDRILKGAKPADLPVEQPTQFELVINMKTARALGLAIPQSVLLRADRVIE
jgi:putative ABC transport system substrate-binding protein